MTIGKALLALALERQRLDQQARALVVIEERNRLAREIHDTLAQSLTASIAVRAASRGQSSLPSTITTRMVERFTVLASREVDADALTEREL